MRKKERQKMMPKANFQNIWVHRRSSYNVVV
jgi:hypothetical protein